jgi:signal peptide peptidase SppA
LINHELLAIAEAHVDRYYHLLELAEIKAAEAHSGGSDEPRESRLIQYFENVAVISIKGQLTDTTAWYNDWLGMTSYDEIREACIQAEEKASAVLFHHGSPGGVVSAMADCANFISNMSIPTVAFTDSMMASASLFLGLQADYVFADGFAEVGSVGVLMSGYDRSEMLKKEGLKPWRIRSGDLKQTGNPNFKLSDKELTYLEEKVMYTAELFYNIVSEARGIPRPMLDQLDITSGRTFIGAQALQVGLIDQVTTFDQALAHTVGLAKKMLDKNKKTSLMFGQ